MKLFRKEKLIEPETYAVINFKEELAKEGICIGGSIAKEILVIRENTVVQILPYSDAYIEYLEEDHNIPVVDATQGRAMPKECEQTPDINIDLGKIFIKPRRF